MLLLLFLAFWCSITLFPHRHLVDGRVYVHSHIYFGGTAQQPAHQHTLQQLQLLAQLASIVLVATALFQMRALPPHGCRRRREPALSTLPNRLVPRFGLRAPPCFGLR